MFRHSRVRLILLSVLFVSAIVPAAVRYVTPSGAGAMNGTNWANAFPGSSLQLAVDASSSGDQVWVAAGTYVPTNGTDRGSSFSMKDGVEIYGSFNGTETALTQRSMSGGPTSVLSGEIGVAGISDNSYNVLRNGNVSRSAVLDGFIIRDGNDDRTATASEGLGGGIFNYGTIGGASSPTIRRCVIVNNRATYGGGIFNNGFNGRTASPLIAHCVISGNTATGAGGGIDNFGVTGNASPEIVNCLIAGNTAPVAGGIYNWGGDNGNASPAITNTAVVYNTATGGNAGGLIADNLNQFGGSSGSSAPVLRNSILWGNSATGSGPQFSVAGTGSVQATYCIVDLTGQTTPHLLSGATTGNGTSDPLFENSASGAGTDGNWMTGDDGFRLQPTSPAVDAGNGTGIPDYDLIYAFRTDGASVDIGPYEEGATAFPVELTSFTAVPRGSGVELRWNTATEVDNLAFEVERMESDHRSDGSWDQWKNIGWIAGHGTTNAPQSYSFTDGSVRGTVRYRLKQIDRDGQFVYSSVVEVTADALPVKSVVVSAYPNPFNPVTNIRYALPEGAEGTNVHIRIFDAMGREVAHLFNLQTGPGEHTVPFNGAPFASGLYLCQLRAGTYAAHTRLMLLK